MAFKAKNALLLMYPTIAYWSRYIKTGFHEKTGILKNICYTKHLLLVKDLKMI